MPHMHIVLSTLWEYHTSMVMMGLIVHTHKARQSFTQPRTGYIIPYTQGGRCGGLKPHSHSYHPAQALALSSQRSGVHLASAPLHSVYVTRPACARLIIYGICLGRSTRICTGTSSSLLPPRLACCLQLAAHGCAPGTPVLPGGGFEAACTLPMRGSAAAPDVLAAAATMAACAAASTWSSGTRKSSVEGPSSCAAAAAAAAAGMATAVLGPACSTCCCCCCTGWVGGRGRAMLRPAAPDRGGGLGPRGGNPRPPRPRSTWCCAAGPPARCCCCTGGDVGGSEG